MNKRNARKLEVWERKILPKIYKSVNEGGVWKRRTNNEVAELYNQPNVTTFCKTHRIRWLGQVVRLSDARTVKKVFTRVVSGRRPRGRDR